MLRTVVIWTLVMEAVKTFETPVNFCESTRRNVLEDSIIHTLRREDLKAHKFFHLYLLV